MVNVCGKLRDILKLTVFFQLCSNSLKIFFSFNMTNSASVHKARSKKKWFSQFGVEELDWPAQSLDLNPTRHQRARPFNPTSVLDFTKALAAELEQNPCSQAPKSGEKSKNQKSGDCYSSRLKSMVL